MTDDPIVAEVCRIRDEHAAKFGYDLKAIYEDIKRIEAESGRKYVNYPPPRGDEPGVVPETAAVPSSADADESQLSGMSERTD